MTLIAKLSSSSIVHRNANNYTRDTTDATQGDKISRKCGHNISTIIKYYCRAGYAYVPSPVERHAARFISMQ